MRPSTFSIVASDPEKREWGVAVASKFLAAGAVVNWARAEVGAIATQALAKVGYGPDGLALLEQGKSADETLKVLIETDAGRAERHAIDSVRILIQAPAKKIRARQAREPSPRRRTPLSPH